ncbi:hypothetical protein GGU10DRAFT_368618 [Lentinula aff. detonsa]|uniref:Histone chaperone RTT106/FACT complex subunit SPT16-like middle domain-containing protein n=1 Tax=Lentinula aff. detonsa TaxID=2804958 RepID=A0AA38KWR0_9AGAR|nr:hypothetical protein GGU10DRAFT_368618 [Lentinula aff. detonsa]
MQSQIPFEFLHVVSSTLPKAMSNDLAALCTSTSSEALLDNLIRFVCGADCSSSSHNEELQWASNQVLVRHKLSELLSSNSSKKRPRDETDLGDSSDSTKKKKLSAFSSTSLENNGVNIDPPKFTLQSVSVTSPIRKKVDITVHQFSMRFVNSSTKALEASLPLSSLKRAFILPTRGKPKPHWTVVVLSNDTGPEKKGKNKSVGTGGDAATEQVIFGIDATATSVITSISHSTDADQSTSLRKGDETLSVLIEFISQLSRVCDALPNPNPITILHLSIEKVDHFKGFTGGSDSAGVTLSPSLAISANLAAKPGTLWFMPSGILWSESKPCMFWSVEDLAKEENVEGVRTISATGRVCTVVLTRKLSSGQDEGECEPEETGFGQIEGKEQEAINQWVKKYRHLFGARERDGGATTTTEATRTSKPIHSKSQSSQPHNPSSVSRSQTQTQAQAGPLTINQMIVDSDDEQDESFDPSNDGSSVSGSESGSDDEDENSDDEQEGEEDADADADADADGESADEDALDGDEKELNPAHHPLLRPGAMPKMSRAAVEMVAGMVEQDWMGAEMMEEDELDD